MGGDEEGAVQLEAEKDDGLENCAPSLRYAIRQLIRRVSSSKEEVFTLQELERQEIEDVRFMMEVNVMGTFHLNKAALPAMKRRTKKTGLAASIAMMSSQAGQNGSRKDMERLDNLSSRHPEFRYKTEFQSHEPEFDYLKSLEIEEKINKIRWCQMANGVLFLLSTNDKTIKSWKDVLFVDSGDPWKSHHETVSRVMKTLEGVHRVLKPEGIFISISSGQIVPIATFQASAV